MNSPEPQPLPHDHDLIDLPDLLRIFKQYRWSIVAIVLLSTIGSALYALSLPKVYRATTTLLIEAAEQKPVAVEDVYDPGLGRPDYARTQKEMIASRELLAPMIDKLTLTEVAEFSQVERWTSRFKKLDWREWLPFLPAEEALNLSPEEKAIRDKQKLMDTLVKDHLKIESVKDTQIVKIHFESQTPKLAADAANTLADLYLESGLRARLDAGTRASSWLTDRLEEIRGQLEASEKALQRYREQEKVVSVGGTRGLSEQELVDYSQRARESEKKRDELASAYAKVQAAGTDETKLKDISVILLDPVVQRANENLLSAQEAVKQLEERYGPNHPQMTTARSRLQGAQSAYREQLRIAAQGVKAEYEIAQENARSMTALVEGAKNRLRLLDRKEYDRSVLEREVTSNRQLYEVFLNRFKETDQTANFEKRDARIVDRAAMPVTPFKPDVRRLVLIGGIAGFLLAVMLILLRHLLNDEVRSADDLEKISGVPVLGVLPEVRGIGNRTNLVQHFIKQPNTAFGEGIRSVRASLQLLDVDKKFKSLLVTSSVPQEGKTSLSATLAISLGTHGRVLLVETDLRLPALSKAFDIPQDQPGLTDVLAGNVPLEQATVQYPGSHNVFILPAGSRTQYPGEIIASAAFRKLTETLASQYDRVVYDTPPCHAASDALVLSSLVNAVLFVVKSDSTSRRAVQNALKQLRNAKAPLIGTLINQVNARRNPYYQEGYYYAYDYYAKTKG